MRHARGFTLIELMVAMAIVAIIGIIGLRGLSTVIDQQAIATERAERWRSIQLAVRILVQDMSQLHPRTTRDETGVARLSSLLADPNHQFPIEFSRGGWSNPASFQRGSVLRVAYDLDDDTLVRIYWPVLDRTLVTEPVVTPLLTGVALMEIRYIDANGEVTLDWPPLSPTGAPSGSTQPPRAVEITLELEDLGRIWRLIEVSS